jgi:ABC-type amino acid transport substrate-binding protein
MKARLLFLIPFLMFSVLNASAESFNVIYFDPDGNMMKIADILSEGKKFLASVDTNVHFIVIGNINVLESEIEKLRPQMMIVNSLYYLDNRDKFQFQPQFIFEREKDCRYTKKLVQIGNSIRSTDDLKNKVIACSGGKTSANRILAQNFDVAKVLAVPNDIDAILAVKFGQADAALTTDTSIGAFGAISPADYDQVKVIASSREIFLPVGVGTKFTKDTVEFNRIIKAFQEIRNSKQGLLFLDSLLMENVQTDKGIFAMLK